MKILTFDDEQIKTLKMGSVVKLSLSFCFKEDEDNYTLLILSDPKIKKFIGSGIDYIKISLHVHHIIKKEDYETNIMIFYSIDGKLDQPVFVEQIAWI